MLLFKLTINLSQLNSNLQTTYIDTGLFHSNEDKKLSNLVKAKVTSKIN